MTSVAVHLRLNEKLAKRIDDLVKQEGYRSRQELIEYALITFFQRAKTSPRLVT